MNSLDYTCAKSSNFFARKSFFLSRKLCANFLLDILRRYARLLLMIIYSGLASSIQDHPLK